MTVSDKLARQVRRQLPEAEAEALLTQAAAPQVQGIPALLKEVDASYASGRSRLKTALRNLDLSSEEQMQAALQMEQLNLSMATVLDSLGQAVLFFDRDGLCAKVFSKACLTLLETNPGGKHVAEVLGLDEDGKKSLQDLIALVFDGESTIFSFDELMKHAPRRFPNAKGLVISLEYRAMYGLGGRLASILVIAQDVTREETVAEEIKAKEARIVRMLRLAKDKMAFVRFLQRMRTVLLETKVKRGAEEIAREIHTLKGMSKFFYLEQIARILHEMESVLQAQSGVSPEELLDTCRETLTALYEEARGYGRELWGKGFELQEDALTLPISQAMSFSKELKAMGAQTASQKFFQKIVAQPVRDLMIPFETQLNYFAEMAEKKISIVTPESVEVRIFAGVYKDFFESLVHVARNIVDHAWQPPAEREQAGKPPELTVKIGAAYESHFQAKVIITIADDGPGVPLDKLRKRLAAAAGQSDDAVLQRIFDSGVTTRDSVSQESGRGIGLAAVKKAAEKLKGTAVVSSKPGQGTVFTFTLPVVWEP
jgi:signal transduction histidine kinase